MGLHQESIWLFLFKLLISFPQVFAHDNDFYVIVVLRCQEHLLFQMFLGSLSSSNSVIAIVLLKHEMK